MNTDCAARGFCSTSRMAMHALIGAIRFLVVIPAFAYADSIHFYIVAQPLPAALQAFAVQAHMQLVYEHATVADAVSNTVSGELDKRVALEQLLRGTGLEIIYSSDNAATIRPARMHSGKDMAKEPRTTSAAEIRSIGVARLP